MSALRRYELNGHGDQPFDKLSGGQQARFQILLLEVGGATALLLDEPTDNLDLASAEALQHALESYEGTTLAVTHDRWFARSLPHLRCRRQGPRDIRAGLGRTPGRPPAVADRGSRPAAGVVDDPVP
jgi:ATPase subunit of ABC transporter with duplicated ATPase domains